MNYLVIRNNLKALIEQAHSLIDLKSIPDRAKTLRYAAKLAGESIDMIHKAEEIKLRVERRAVVLLTVAPKQKPSTTNKGIMKQPLTSPDITGLGLAIPSL